MKDDVFLTGVQDRDESCVRFLGKYESSALSIILQFLSRYLEKSNLFSLKLEVFEERVELLPYPSLLFCSHEGDDDVTFANFRSGRV